MDNFEKLKLIVEGLNKRFPNGNDPFKIITRLAEETGELAEQVNHFEDTGIKKEKHGEPSKEKLAKEVQDVIRCALAIANFYGIEKELEESIDKSLEKLKSTGLA